ncbi:MAG TPA: phosphatidylglycerophosphatase A [Vicinamibacterales bacterium]|nr:phosphatidylglycerophosphatase A [Vicinamibacterales bacterium]
MTRLAIFLCTFGYIGYSPIAPGTVGSAAGLVIYALVALSGAAWVEAAAMALVFAAGVWSATVGEHYFGGIDPGPVVIDEVLGMLVTLAFVPVGLKGAIVGFFVFRVFDVIKPFPAGRLERLHGGLGVMADDAAAAVYGNIVMRLLAVYAPGFVA